MTKLKEYKLSKDTFMGGWFIPDQVCDNLITYYYKNQNKVQVGEVSVHQSKNISEIRKDHKISKELGIEPDNYDREVERYRFYLQECLLKYVKKYPTAHTSNTRYNISTAFNYQHYEPGEGFKTWHCERGGKHNGTRVLVFMTYLNDLDDGGTIFKNFKLTTPAKKGLTLIWPTDWPWTHKGQISKTKEKHIITGWYDFV